MQRGRFLILVGIMLALAAVGLLLATQGSSKDEEKLGEEPAILVPTPMPTWTPVPMASVVVAKQYIERGTLFVPNTIDGYVSVEDWPLSWATEGALVSLDEVSDRIARSDIPRGTVLTADMLTDLAGDLAPTGSDAALLIPPDRVAIAIPVDHISSVGWSLRRGDHVDILISFLMIDLDEEFQTELPNKSAALISITEEDKLMTEEGMKVIQGELGRIETDPFGNPINVLPNEGHQRPRLVSQVTVRDAEVLNVAPWGELFRASGQTDVSIAAPVGEEGAGSDGGGQAPDGAEGGGETTTMPQQQVQIILLEDQKLTPDEILREYLNVSTLQPLLLIVSPQDALVLTWAGEQQSPMHVVLRSYADAGVRLPDTEAVTFEYMVNRFSIGLPAGLPYGVEPAVYQLERSFLKLPDELWEQWSVQTPTTEGPPR